MKKVITYGTFDCFHYGHYNLLKRAKELGDYLIVGISTDEMCYKKGKMTILDECKRMEIVSNLKFVDEVLFEHNMEQKVKDVLERNVDIFTLGSDYSNVFPQMPEYKQLVDLGCSVVFLERTSDISTSQIKQKLWDQNKMDEDYTSVRALTKDGNKHIEN